MSEKVKIKVLNFCCCLFVLSLFSSFVGRFIYDYSLLTWGISEFLINYQAGFVRRGLTGEILFHFIELTHFDIELTVKLFCSACFFIVCIFFIKKFIEKGYSLYILPLCFFLSAPIMANFWIRKDCFLICLFLLIFFSFFTQIKIHILIRIFIVNLLLIIALLTHEVFVFFTFPILFVLLFNHIKQGRKVIKTILLISISLFPSILVVFSVFISHGDVSTAQLIWDSWSLLLNNEITSIDPLNSIGAIGWSLEYAVKGHLGLNFFIDNYAVLSILYWIIILPVVYYISINTFLVFKGKANNYTDKHRNVLSCILIFQFICLIPVFVFLSCDYSRLIFYCIISSFAIFLIVPFNYLDSIFPKRYYIAVNRINTAIDSFIFPSKTILVFLMLIIGIPNVSFSIDDYYSSTMGYRILYIISKPFVLIDSLFFS